MDNCGILIKYTMRSVTQQGRRPCNSIALFGNVSSEWNALMYLGVANPVEYAPNPIPVLGCQEEYRNLSQQTASSNSLLDPSVAERALADGAISSLPLNTRIDMPTDKAETRKSLRVSPLLMNGQIGTAEYKVTRTGLES